jgi:hypothetical protein
MTLRNFQDCIRESGDLRHLLLGNGFSRACRDQIFSYDSLFEAADWKGADERIKRAFDAINTRDFEQVMELLELCSSLSQAYAIPAKVKDEMKTDAQLLRRILVETLARHHPVNPSEISDDEYQSCQKFLSNFERIYTVNYDLLLYWTMMKGKRAHDDGFRDPHDGNSDDYREEDFVEWKNFDNKQTIYYLHGALHLFLAEASLKKYCWSRTGIKLKDQILASLEQRHYPLIVAAGRSNQKLSKIQRSNYLGHGFRSIRKIGGSLFLYGLSLGDKDAHISQQIAGNTSLKRLYVGLFGDPASKANQELIKNANIATEINRHRRKKVSIEFYDSKSAEVWSA